MSHLRFRPLLLAAPVGVALLTACGGGGGSDAFVAREVPLTVSKVKVARCGEGDTPETALQGQVPAALRAAGFQGFNCNLQLVGRYEGEGGSWSSATFTDRAGRTCTYPATGAPLTRTGEPTGRLQPGVPVIDITDPANPIRTTSLTTVAMLGPWESLRANAPRGLLVADNAWHGAGGPEIDLYDVSSDCRSPQLLATVPVATGTDGGVTTPLTAKGHEGNISPDGLTYWIGDRGNQNYIAVDISNPTQPKAIARWDLATLGLANAVIHGLSLSRDGNRAYASVAYIPRSLTEVADPDATLKNGFVVLDTSEVQARKPNAQIRLVSTVLYKDGAQTQHQLPIKVNGKPYLVQVDEAGSGGLGASAQVRAACDVGLAPFPMARIFDMRDETHPRIVSKLGLETHDPKNCDQVLPDIEGLGVFTYGSHYCSVDNRENATALACSYFNSGIRVFDIRNPAKPKEIAYYNPASSSAKPGSDHVAFGQYRPGGPDWCASRLDFDFKKRLLVTHCQDYGVVVLRFGEGTWPFKESTEALNES
jgi:hypothetical protein